MSANAIVSAANDRRIRRARAWLEGRLACEEVLIVGASPDAANELARSVATTKGAAFGWHRLTLLLPLLRRPFLQRAGSPRSAELARTPLPLGSRTG